MASLKIVSSTFLVTILFLLQNDLINAQETLQSPCPRLFAYDKKQEPDRWHGAITLLSETDITGILLRVTFDKQSLQLGNWFSEVVSIDNKEYLFQNPTFKLKANVPHQLKFFIKYNPSLGPPKLISFKLNDKLVCPEGAVAVEAGNRDGDVKPGGAEPNLNDICGTIVPQPRPLIAYGEPTRVGEFPWHAALYHAKGIDLVYHCGASLISKNYVITTAHCVTRKNSKILLNFRKLAVYLGQYKLEELSSPGIQEKKVAKTTIHLQYNEKTFANNIALVKLTTPADFTDYVRPICLWEESDELTPVLNKEGTVVGWGFDESGELTERLTQAKMPVVSYDMCTSSLPDFYPKYMSSNTYCAGFRNGTSVCNGDSGGGMVFPKPGATFNRPLWQLRGLISIGVTSQNQLKCDTLNYVVFTDAAKYLGWIKKTMELN